MNVKLTLLREAETRLADLKGHSRSKVADEMAEILVFAQAQDDLRELRRAMPGYESDVEAKRGELVVRKRAATRSANELRKAKAALAKFRKEWRDERAERMKRNPEFQVSASGGREATVLELAVQNAQSAVGRAKQSLKFAQDADRDAGKRLGALRRYIAVYSSVERPATPGLALVWAHLNGKP